MWIISQTGFVSLIQDRQDHSKVWVRARIKEDIAMMFPAFADQIVTKIGADYIYRLIVPKDVAALAMWNAVQDVDYDSHAKEVMNRRSHPNRDRMGAYYKIWNALAALQPFAPYAHYPRSVAGMNVHHQPALTGKGYPWARNPDFSGRPLVSGYRNGQPLTAEDYRPQSLTVGDYLDSDDDGDWPASEAVDLINDANPDPGKAPEGIPQQEWDNMTPAEWEAAEKMTDEEWEVYLIQRETERTGPTARKKRNPRRKATSRRAPATNVKAAE